MPSLPYRRLAAGLVTASLPVLTSVPAVAATSTEPGSSRRVVVAEQHGRHLVVRTRTLTGAADSWADAAEQEPHTVAADVDKPVQGLGVAGALVRDDGLLNLDLSALNLSHANDPLRSAQWADDYLTAEDVWSSGTGAGQVVAVVDSGVDATQDDLAGMVLPGADFVTGKGDGRTDPSGHGTHVAGILAAAANNARGVAGFAPGVKILPVRVLDANDTGYASNAARGVIWAADHGADVINLSLGQPQANDVLHAAVDYARAKNVVVVAGAGNSGSAGDPVIYPAAFPGVLAVGAIDQAGSHPGFSETGPDVDLAAPGVSVLSTEPGDRYGYMTGTSVAAPYAAAAAALLRASGPSLTGDQVAATLQLTARNLGAPGRDNLYGYGSPDVRAARDYLARFGPPAVTAAGAPVPSPAATSRVALAGPAVVPAGANASFAATARADGSPLGFVPAVLERRAPGSTVWRKVATATSDRTGSFTFQDRVSTTADYRLRMSAGVGYRGAVSPIVLTAARARISLAVAHRQAQGVLTPRLKGVKVMLQQRQSGRWTTIAQSQTSVDGRYTVKLPAAAHGVVRVRSAGCALATGAMSGTVRLS